LIDTVWIYSNRVAMKSAMVRRRAVGFWGMIGRQDAGEEGRMAWGLFRGLAVFGLAPLGTVCSERR
jgi:hypothetical protein